MQAAIESIEEHCGERPRGWYCRYGPSVNTRELLVEEGGFVYDADAYNDDLPYFVDVHGTRHLVVPYSFTYNAAGTSSLRGMRIRPISSTTASVLSTSIGARERPASRR